MAKTFENAGRTPYELRMRAFQLSDKAIITPKADLLCVGGLSILIMCALTAFVSWEILSGLHEKSRINMIDLFVFQALLNWPHFIASYRLLYGDSGNIRRYRLAALYVPAALIIVCALALFSARAPGETGFVVHQGIAYYLWLTAAFYLAWHYVGQAWGMVAVFAQLSGARLLGWEKQAIRFGLRSMIVWHVVWGIQGMPQDRTLAFFQSPEAMTAINVMAIAAFCAGLFAFASLLRREKKIDPRMIAPWLALYMWYLVLFLEPDAFLFIQLSHALQYIIFPARIELNKRLPQIPTQMQTQAQRAPSKKRRKAVADAAANTDTGAKAKALLPLAGFYLAGIALGLMIFYVPDLLIGDSRGMMTIGGMLALAVNIHHYYTDSAIWKLRDKSVQAQLFGSYANTKTA